jgi:hypothetical protein
MKPSDEKAYHYALNEGEALIDEGYGLDYATKEATQCYLETGGVINEDDAYDYILCDLREYIRDTTPFAM